MLTQECFIRGLYCWASELCFGVQQMQQLVDPDQVKNEKKLSPAIYAALVDSLFQNPLPMLAGAICVGAAAVMTAWKTGVVWLWPCALLIVAIGVMKPDGSGERIMTSGFHNEGPTWAPNGRVLMFFREAGPGPSLFTVDVSGRFEQRLQTPSFASDPAWSPLLT